LTDRDRENLLKKIARGKCVPFLEAGACYSALPLGGEGIPNGAQRNPRLAMLRARLTVARNLGGLGTWGAYQHYGNPHYRILSTGKSR
jgi:hypothetical protein